MIATRKAWFLLILTSLYLPPQVSAAGNTFEIDVNELDQKAPAAQKKEARPKKLKAAKKKAPKPIVYTDGYAKYTIQESDFRVRLLAKHLHLPEDELQRLLPEILRLNGISSLSELEIGQTLLVPIRPKEEPPAGSGEAPSQGAPAQQNSAPPGAPVPAEGSDRR